MHRVKSLLGLLGERRTGGTGGMQLALHRVPDLVVDLVDAVLKRPNHLGGGRLGAALQVRALVAGALVRPLVTVPHRPIPADPPH